MDLTYEKCGDYLTPNLIPDPEPEEALTKYGLMRRNYLEEHRRGVYSGLLMTGELKAHCLEIQRQTEERMDFLTEQMTKAEGVDEELKASDQMKWVRRMNNIRARVEEIVLKEIVYN
ncbi:MAG: TnpV protein [Lachnospiraceae bacterium]|nr:TnpV protein [Lachnospiraceae bacterium]